MPKEAAGAARKLVLPANLKKVEVEAQRPVTARRRVPTPPQAGRNPLPSMRPENRSELGLGSNMGLADSPFSKSALLQHCLLHSNVRDGDRGEGRQDSNLLTSLPGEWVTAESETEL